jgi:hypothetical protein
MFQELLFPSAVLDILKKSLRLSGSQPAIAALRPLNKPEATIKFLFLSLQAAT